MEDRPPRADPSEQRAGPPTGSLLTAIDGIEDLRDGFVTIDMGPGKGTEFVVTLRAEPEPPRDEASDRPSPAARGRLRVLVVEDNPDAADSLKRVLELHGHEVATACSGPLGLQLARATRPDLVLCDIGLPGMDGYEVARALRADPALDRTKLVALSGYGQPEDVLKARDAGFDGHLTKPVDPEVLARLAAASRA